MYDFMSDDQESDVSIANLTVQIFTTPSVAHHLIAKANALEELVNFFAQIFDDEAKIEGGNLDLTEWLEERQYDFKRCSHILTDIQYLLGVPPNVEEWSRDMRKNFVNGTKALIDLVAKLQLADQHVRQLGAHVVYESRNWANIFTITSHLMGMANLAKQWCKVDSAALHPIFK